MFKQTFQVIPNFITIEITSLQEQLHSIAICTNVHCCTSFHFQELSVYLLTFYMNMHSNSLPLLGICTPKNLSSIIQLSPIRINLGVLIRKGVHVLHCISESIEAGIVCSQSLCIITNLLLQYSIVK